MTRIERIITSITEVANTLEIHPHEVTVSHLKKAGKITDWDLKQIPGGLTSIKNAHFPIVTKDLVVAKEVKDVNKYIKTLENKLASKEFYEKILKESVEKNLEPIELATYKKPKVVKKSLQREIVVMLNDTHIGCIIDGEEIGNVNKFDFKEAGRRFAYIVKQTIEYKRHVRNEVGKVHVILNGDIIAGLIHGLATKGIHLMIHQINAANHIICHAIQALAAEFPEVQVHGIAGNHDRGIHKEHGKRPVSEVYDSYANVIYYSLSMAFRHEKRVRFNFPKTPYGFINLPAGRAMYCHGDHIFSSALGNPGKKINVADLGDAIHKFNMGEIDKGEQPIKLLLFGHVHTFTHFITDGVEVYVAPSLSGLDPFAHSLTINHNFTAQALFESTQDFIFGDSRLIRVDIGDDLEELDKIIPVYSKELAFKG